MGLVLAPHTVARVVLLALELRARMLHYAPMCAAVDVVVHRNWLRGRAQQLVGRLRVVAWRWHGEAAVCVRSAADDTR